MRPIEISTGGVLCLFESVVCSTTGNDKHRNAVELMIKTYLGLPRRVTGLEITRKEYQEFSQSFPKLLDALEVHGTNKISGINLGEIEWHHRLGNELYHQGNGLTVERDKVEVYAELANLLFENVFGFLLLTPSDDATKLLGEFMAAWIDFERALAPLETGTFRVRAPLDVIRRLRGDKLLSESELAEIDALRHARNEVVQGRLGEVKTEYSECKCPSTESWRGCFVRWRSKSEFAAPSDWVFASPFAEGKSPYFPTAVRRKIHASSCVRA